MSVRSPRVTELRQFDWHRPIVKRPCGFQVMVGHESHYLPQESLEAPPCLAARSIDPQLAEARVRK
jgi:hypothetical protein